MGIAQLLHYSPVIIITLALLGVIITKDLVYARFIGYFIITELLTDLLKFSFRGHSFADRPEGAKNCSLIAKNSFEKTSGMPSGHTTLSTMTAVFWALKSNDPVMTLLLLLFAFSVGASRIANSCHTPEQVTAGWILGTVLGYTFYRLENYLAQ